ncbi:type IV pilus modification protein PilV [Marinobacter segnicrescens]|uniref:type IV pilus modification protein PilV n=1 Tax=Marinobacter segnicrescens TaxID=430453 RepID=UPI003A9101A2
MPVNHEPKNRSLDLAASRNRAAGFTLIEIMVTMFILAIGLLGLAALVVDGMRNNQGAYLRTQASTLAYDMADRIRLNRDRAEDGGDYDGFSTDGASTTLPNCYTASSGCTPEQQVDVDKVQWTRQIQGVGSGIPLLPGGEGEIDFDAANNAFVITVTWQERSRDGDAGEAIAGDGSYTVRFTL